MNIKKILFLLVIFNFAVIAFGDGGYASFLTTERPPGHADWWVEGDTAIDYPIRIEVMDSSVGIFGLTRGQFGVGGIGTGYIPLMRNFHWPDSIAGEHFVLYIDGAYYSFANYTASQLTLCSGPPVSLHQINDYFMGSDTVITIEGIYEIHSHWQIPIGVGGLIDFYQILKPVSMVFGPDTCGQTRILFQAFNQDFVQHSIGVKFIVDAFIGTSDRPSIMIAGTYTTLSRFYEAPVPSYWQGADNPDISLASAIARGILRGGDATPPDYFAIGQQSPIWRYIWVRTDLGCHPDSEYWATTFSGNPTGDVAFLVQWNQRSISAGSHFDWVTYYGFGSGYQPPAEMPISPIVPEISCHDCTIDTLVDIHTLVTQHDASGNTYLNDTICIYPPSPITVYSAYWDNLLYGGHIIDSNCILLDSLPTDSTVDIEWTVHIPESLHLTGLTGNLGYYGNSNDVTEATDSFVVISVPMFSGIPPNMTLLTAPSFFVNCTTFKIDVYFTDDEGIDQSSVLPNINGYSSAGFVNWHPPVNPLDDTFFVDVPGTLFTVDSLETVLVLIPPIADGCGCRSAETLRTTIIWDNDPPIITDLIPIDSGYATTSTPNIGFTVCDSISGVQIDSIEFFYTYGTDTIFLSSTSSGIVRIPDADTHCVDISFTPTDIPSETTVTVCVTYAIDNVDATCSPNVADTTCWSFIVDYTAPVVEFIAPPDSVAYVSCDTPTVCFVVNDMNGFLTTPCESLVVWIESAAYNVCDPNVYINGDTVCIDDAYNSPYPSGTEVNVIIMKLCDTLGNSIGTSTPTYTFLMDTQGPWVASLDPPDGSFITPPSPVSDPVCSLLVNDDYSGINLSYITVKMSINGGPDSVLTYPTDLSFSSGWLVVHADLYDAGYLDTVCFTLDTIFDNADVCPANNIETPFTWCYIIDNQPPEAILVQPEDSATWACGLGEGWICIDFIDINDINPGSVVVTVGNSAPVSSGWLYYSDVDRFCGPIPIDAIINSCEPVPIVIVQVADNLGNIALFADTFYFTSDLEGPYAGYMYPNATTTAEDSVVFEVIDDCSPISESQTCFEITVRNMGSTVTNITVCGDDPDINWFPGAYSSDDTARFHINDILDSLGMELGSGDSVYVCLVQSFDTLDDNTCGYNGISDTTCLSFFYSLGGPSIAILDPPVGSSISCETLCITFAFQDSDGVDSSSIHISYQINGGPVSDVTIADPFVTWVSGSSSGDPDNLILCIPDILMDGYEITFSVDSVQDYLGVPNTAPRGGTYWMDWTPPQIGVYWPTDWEEIFTARPLIWIVANDLIAGVNQQTGCFTFGGLNTYCWDDSIVYWSGDTAFFSALYADTIFRGGDTVEICFEVADNAIMCDSNVTDTCWHFTVAAGGPIVDAIEPAESSIITCDTIDSLVIVATDENGIDINTFHIVADGAGASYDITYPNPAIHTSGDTIIIDAVFADEGTVSVTIEIQDSLGNIVSGGFYEYWFVIDHSAPLISEYTPLCDSTAMNIPETLWVIAEDSLGYPDPNMFCIGIIDTNGDTTRVCGSSSSAIVGVGDTIFIILDSLGISYTGGDTIVWWIEQFADYSDLCTPNYGVVGDTCRIPISSTGPDISIINPLDINGDGYIYFGCTYPYTFAFLLDDPDGFDTSSICVNYFCIDSMGDTIPTVSQCWPDPDLSVIGDTLLWDVLSFPCPAGNEMHITVEVLDNLLNPQRPNEFIVIIDTTAPGFEIISPLWTENVMTLTPDILLRFPDAASPDTNLICVTLMWNTLFMPANTLEVCNIDDTIEWSNDTLTLHIPSGLFDTGDSVQICVDTVWDAADACPNWAFIDTCYWIYIAQGGPTANLIYPVPDSVGLVCANDSFVFVLSDPDGVDTSTVHFADDGTEHPIGTNPYWANETTLVYVPPSPYSWSPIYLSLWGMQDLLGYEADSIVFTLYIDVDPPVANWVSPGSPPEPITIPPGTPPFQIHIVDSLNAVDSTTILFFPHGLDGLSYPVDAILGDDDTLTWNIITSILEYDASVSYDTFLAGDTDSVCIIVADNPNCAGYINLDTTCWEYIVSATSGPIPTLIIPDRDSATIACDSFVIEWSCYTTMGLRHSNAQVSLQIGDTGTPVIYDDVSGAISYIEDTLIFGPPPALFTDGDTIYVQIIHIEDALGNPTDSSTIYTFFIDWSGPSILAEYPSGIILDPHPTIWFYFDDLSRIDTTTSVVTVNIIGGTSTTYRITDPAMFWNTGSDTLFLDGLEFSGGDSVQVCLDSIADMPDTCGPNWTTDTCFIFKLPQGGPIAEFIIPWDSTTTFCADQNIIIELCDSQGVLFDSLIIYIQHGDGTIDSFDAGHISNMALITHIIDSLDSIHCDTIIVPPLTSFTNGETVQVTLAQVLDTLFNPGFPAQLTFIVDLSAPVGDNFIPTDGEVIFDWSQHISAQVWDSVSWLDTNAISVLITDNGNPLFTFEWDSTQLWYDNSDSTIHIQIDSLWHEFHEYCIYLNVQDSTDTVLCPANNNIIGWCFTVGDDDSTGPEILVSDTCNWPAMSSDFFVTCSLWDTSGIYDDATDTNGQGIFLVYDTAGCPDLSTGNYVGIVQLDYTAGDDFGGTAQTMPGAFPLFDVGTWVYYIVYAYDNDFDFDTTFDRTQAYSVCESCYFHDIDAPSIWADNPRDGWFYSCTCDNQELIIGFHDYDGFDIFGGILGIPGTLEVNGIEYPFDTLSSPEISFTGAISMPGTTYLHFTPDNCWQNGDTVNVRVWHWADIFGNIWENALSEDSIYTYSFTIDWMPPIVYYEHCYDDTNLYIDQFDTVNIDITDELAGVNPDSIGIEIVGKHLQNGIYNPTSYDYINSYTIGDNGVSYDEPSGKLTLIIPMLPYIAIENEDSVWIVISNACDNSRGCGANCIADSLFCPKYIVAEFVCRSHPNPFTPNNDGSNDNVYIEFPKMVFRNATVFIYDMQGVELQKINVGDAHSYSWDGKDSDDNDCRPGVYLYVIKDGDEVICTGTLVLAR